MESEVKIQPTTAGLTGEPATVADSAKSRFRKIEDILSPENGDAIVHNFMGDPMDIYRMTALATGGACRPFDEMPADGIDLQNWFCHRVDMKSQHGEFITPIRTVLIDKSGSAYSFVSDGIARELDTLRSVFGDGPYTGPMRIKVSKIQTRGKTSTYVMGPV